MGLNGATTIGIACEVNNLWRTRIRSFRFYAGDRSRPRKCPHGPILHGRLTALA